MGITWERRPTCDPYPIDVIRHDALSLDDIVQLRPRTVQHYRVQPHSVQKAQIQGQLIEVVQYGASYLDNGEFCGLGRVRGGRKDAQMAFDLAFGAERV